MQQYHKLITTKSRYRIFLAQATLNAASHFDE